MRELVGTCLKNKRWRKKHKPKIKRDITEALEYSEDDIGLRLYTFGSTPIEEDLVGVLISCAYELYPVTNDGIYAEFSHMLTNEYLYKEVSLDYFDDWAKEGVSRYFPVIFFDTPLVERVWILLDEHFAKDALLQHVDKSVSYLHWRSVV